MYLGLQQISISLSVGKNIDYFCIKESKSTECILCGKKLLEDIVLEIYFRDFKKKINYKNVEKILKKIDQQRRGHPLSNG